MLADGSHLCDHVEDRQHSDRALLYPCAEPVRNAPRDVLVEAAACDVGDALDIHLFKQSEYRLYVYLRWFEQSLAERLSAEHRVARSQRLHVSLLEIEDLAHEGESVGVDSARRQSDHNVAGLHLIVVYDLVLVYDTCYISCEVVLVSRIESRHLSRLAADQRSARLHAALAHACNDLLDPLRHVLAACDVVEEEQRLCTCADDVIDAHRNAVDADRVVLVQQESQLELGADTVSAAYEDRLLNVQSLEVQLKQSAESADASHDARCDGPCDVALHELNRSVTCSDIYSGSSVAVRS